MAWLPAEPVTSVPSTKAVFAFSGTDSFWFTICLGYLALVFMLGGSPRPEVAALPFLRGIAVFFVMLGLIGLTRSRVGSVAPLSALTFVSLSVLPLLHLVPLPPGWAASLPGREVLGEIDRAIGAENLWRPITLSPLGSANALLAGSIPFAAFVLGLNLPGAHHKRLAEGLLGLGVISLCLALGQILASQDSALYLYETTNRGSPVGLFANRNHHAVFLSCLIVLAPIALSSGLSDAVLGSQSMSEGIRSVLLLLMCSWIAGMVLLTGSRSGVLTTSLALMSVPIIIAAQTRTSRLANIGMRVRNGVLRIWALLISLCLIIPFAIWVERAPALNRLLGTDPDAEARLRILPQVFELTKLYWPLGSGIGSFEKAFQLHEPRMLLSSAYMNHAHNDVLEVVMTAGLAGLLVMLCAAALWMVLAFRVFVIDQSDAVQPLRKAGLTIILLLSLASLTDYPLRNPALSVVFVFAWIWAALPYHRSLSR